jgi:hypothetical protein
MKWHKHEKDAASEADTRSLISPAFSRIDNAESDEVVETALRTSAIKLALLTSSAMRQPRIKLQDVFVTITNTGGSRQMRASLALIS